MSAFCSMAWITSALVPTQFGMDRSEHAQYDMIDCHYEIKRMVRGVFHVGGFLHLDALGYIVQIVLNQDALLTRSVITSLRELLARMHIVIHLAKTQVHNAVV